MSKFFHPVSIFFLLWIFGWQCTPETKKTTPPTVSSDTVIQENIQEVEGEKPGPNPNQPTPPKQVEGKLFMVDEAAQRDDFIRFRVKLMVAIQERDLDYLMSIIDPQMKVSIADPGEGPEAFKALWGLAESPRRSGVWKKLYATLLKGGVFNNKEKTSFTTNYVFTSLPVQYDPFLHVVINGDNVRMRSKPSLKGSPVGVLDHDIVEVLQDDLAVVDTIGGETYPWVKIRVPKTKQTGYVFGKFVESPLGMRARFEYKNGAWKMVSMVAGD